MSEQTDPTTKISALTVAVLLMFAGSGWVPVVGTVAAGGNVSYGNVAVESTAVFDGETAVGNVDVTLNDGESRGEYSVGFEANGDVLGWANGTLGGSLGPASASVRLTEPAADGDLSLVTGQTRTVQETISVDDAWASLGGGPENTGVDASAAGLEGRTELDWVAGAGNVRSSSPAVYDGMVYVGSVDGKVYAFDASSGETAWTFDTGQDIRSAPAVADGRVYIGSNDASVYALDATTGTKDWEYTTGNAVTASITVFDGTVYAGSTDTDLHAIYAENGTQKWQHTSPGADILAGPAVSDGSVYYGDNAGTFYAVYASNGSTKWSVSTPAAVQSSPAVRGDTVYVMTDALSSQGDDQNTLWALATSDGSEQWTKTFDGYDQSDIESSPAVTSETVYVGVDSGAVYALDRLDGGIQWSQTTTASIYSSPAVVNGSVYIGTWNNTFLKLDAGTGDPEITFFDDYKIDSSPALVDDQLFFVNQKGYLAAWSRNETTTTSTTDSTASSTTTDDPEPEIELDTDQVAFGEVGVNTTATETVTVSNVGDATLTVSDIRIEGIDDTAYRATPTSFEVAPGESSTVTVTFEPTEAGTALAGLGIASNDPDQSLVGVELGGEGVASDLTSNQTGLSFGSVSLGDTSTEVFPLVNEGATSVRILNVSISGDTAGQFRAGDGATELAPGERTAVPLSFTPTTLGQSNATLSVETDSEIVETIERPLTGTGVGPNTTITDGLSFDSVPVGGNETGQLTIQNDGAGKLSIRNLSVTAPGAFTLDRSSLTVAPNQSETVTVRFRPVTPGPVSATVTAESNDPAGLPPVTLNGTGTTANLSVTPLTVDFGTQRDGVTTNRSVTVRNNGTRPVAVTNITRIGSQFGLYNRSLEPLEPGDNTTFTVSYSGRSAATHRGRVLVETNDTALSTVTVALRGTTTAPDVQVRPESLRFGNVTVNETVTRELTVGNPGTAPLNVTGSSFAGVGRDVYTLRADTPFTVPAGTNRSATVAFTPDRARTFSGTLTLDTSDPDEGSVPIWVTNSNTTVDIDVQGTNETQRLNATVENVEPNESVTINTSTGNPDQSVSVNTVSVTTETSGDFSLNMTSQPDPDETTPEFNTSTGTEPLQYINVSHSIPNAEIEQAAMTVRLSKDRIEAMETTDPEDVSLYRYENGTWTEKPTRIERETATHVIYNVSANGFSEWTAGAKQAQFELLQADVNVSTIRTGDSADINVRISNTGGADGEFLTELLLNGEVVESRSIEISAGGASQVTFRRSFDDAGTYSLRVNDFPVGTVTVQPRQNETTATATVTPTPATAGTDTSLPVVPLAIGVIVVLAGGLVAWRRSAAEDERDR